MLIKMLTVGLLEENCYVLGCPETRQAVIIDPGDSAREILQEIEKDNLTPAAIVNTHAHFDHVMAVNGILDKWDIPFYLHAEDLTTLESCPQAVMSWLGSRIPPIRPPDRWLEAGQTLRFGTISLEVRFTPGHSPGHVVFVAHSERLVLAGDTLFHGSIGRYDLPGADGPRLLQSIKEELLTLEDDFTVYPGHGQETTIGYERVHNPFVGQHASMAP